MALSTSYLITTRNLEPFFNSLINAKAPDTFTQKFLESLEFKSTNDRLYIGLLKSLGFLDENSVPTQRYYQFLDQGESKKVLAEGIRYAYEDLFSVNVKANELSPEEVKNKLKTLTQGKKSEDTLSRMATTFKGLCDYADFRTVAKQPSKMEEKVVPEKPVIRTEELKGSTPSKEEESKVFSSELHYNIQIHLPESRDPAVYDAIFKSLKDHLF